MKRAVSLQAIDRTGVPRIDDTVKWASSNIVRFAVDSFNTFHPQCSVPAFSDLYESFQFLLVYSRTCATRFQLSGSVLLVIGIVFASVAVDTPFMAHIVRGLRQIKDTVF